MSRRDYEHAIVEYCKILRKEHIRHSPLTIHTTKNISPQLTQAYKNMAQRFYDKGKKFLQGNRKQGLLEYQKIAQLSKDYEKLHDFYQLTGDDDEWNKMRADVYFKLGSYLFMKGDLSESAEQLKYVAIFNPDYGETYHLFNPHENKDYKRFGLLLSHLGLWNAACQQFEKYISLEPEDLKSRYILALLYRKKGMIAQAYEQFHKILEVSEKRLDSIQYLSPLLGRVYYYLALQQEEQGNKKAAIENFKKSVALCPGEMVEAYVHLISLYQQQKNQEEAQKLFLQLLNLEPEYKIDYKDEHVVLLGYSFDEIEFEMTPQLNMIFFWKVQGPQNPQAQNKLIEIVVDTPYRKLYRAGESWYEVKKITNLVPDPGFEIDNVGAGFPMGWTQDMYAAPRKSYEIAMEKEASPWYNQFFLLNNAFSRRTGRMTGLISVDPQKLYLQAGQMKGYRSNGCLGREWRNVSTGKQIGYNYVVTAVASSDWRTYSQVLRPPGSADHCYLWILNFETEGKAYFDNILFSELKVPDEIYAPYNE